MIRKWMQEFSDKMRKYCEGYGQDLRLDFATGAGYVDIYYKDRYIYSISFEIAAEIVSNIKAKTNGYSS